MDIDLTITYPADPDRVMAALTDPEYTRSARLHGTGVDPAGIDVDVREEGERTVVETSGPVPADLVPGAARRFVPEGMRLTLTETWGAPASDGAREGTLELHAGTLPVTLRGTQRLVPVAAGTERRVDAALKVSIPLVGGAAERQAAGRVDTVVRAEEAAARRWLDAS